MPTKIPLKLDIHNSLPSSGGTVAGYEAGVNGQILDKMRLGRLAWRYPQADATAPPFQVFSPRFSGPRQPYFRRGSSARRLQFDRFGGTRHNVHGKPFFQRSRASCGLHVVSCFPDVSYCSDYDFSVWTPIVERIWGNTYFQMTDEASEQLTEPVGSAGARQELHARYDSYRSLADPSLVIFVPENIIPPFRFKVGGWEPLQSSVELSPEAKHRIAQQGYLIESPGSMSAAALTPPPNSAPQNDPDAPSLEVEFALVISRMIDSIERSPQGARQVIYDLARYKLEEQLSQAKPEEKRHTQRALEVAIRNVEIFSEKHAHALPASHQPRLSSPDGGSIDTKPPPARELVSQVGPRLRVIDQKAGRGVRKSNPWSYLRRTTAVIATVVAILVAFQHRGRLASLTRNVFKPDRAVTVAEQSAPSPPPSPIVPPPPQQPALPTDYGVYAITDDAPVDLTRVGITTVLTTPSATVLPNGRPKFIVFSRDLTASIGDRAEVRVLARVMREFSANVAGKKPTEEAWVMRNVSFRFRSSPVKDHADMTELHSEDPGLELTPGRYALVLKTQAYDFSVEGKVSDPRHCIERIIGPVGITYASCKDLPP